MVTKHLVPRSQMTAVDVGSADHGTTTNSRAQAGGVPRTANENTSAEQPAGESVAASTSARSASARETELEPKVKKQKRGPSAVSRKQQTPFIDLTGVPTQPLILKNEISSSGYKDNSRRRPVKASSEKYDLTSSVLLTYTYLWIMSASNILLCNVVVQYWCQYMPKLSMARYLSSISSTAIIVSTGSLTSFTNLSYQIVICATILFQLQRALPRQ